jgi:poly-gamma-glutamate synthesis protein (capsule biosynthesis protein)
VALVSATSSARPNSRAGEQRRDINGRPGVNLIRWINEWTVDEDAFAALGRIARQFDWEQRMPAWWSQGYGFDEAAATDAVHLPDRNILGVGTEDPAARFVRGTSFERHSRMFRPDLERNLHSVDEARRMADWVIFSIHNHEGAATDDEPSDHVRELARAVIDAGADVVVGHGPHRDRGIEIYRDRPILYSLGNFIMQNDTVARLPQDAMVLRGLGHENVAADFYDARAAARGEPVLGPSWWSMVPVVGFEAGKLREITLHPVELGFGLSRAQMGRPMLAEGELATRILEHLQWLCKPFGTAVEIRGEVGAVAVS